jgi:hypothetical protein
MNCASSDGVFQYVSIMELCYLEVRKPDVLVLRNTPERADQWARYCEGDQIKD